MDLKTFLEERYRGLEGFERWKARFPEMFEFAKEVEVIPWDMEFAVADKNAEVLDEIEFYEELARNGLMDWEEVSRKREELLKKSGYVSRTEGIAFIEDKRVSFRKSVPPLGVALHELGHVFFEETDAVWSATYGGGEELMWLIIRDIYKPQIPAEEAVRNYNRFFKFALFENPEKAEEIMSEIAEEIMDRYNLKGKMEGFPIEPKSKIDELMLWIGTIPTSDNQVSKNQSILVNHLENIRWRGGFTQISQEFITEIAETDWDKVLRDISKRRKNRHGR